jgi:hypothetical protein
MGQCEMGRREQRRTGTLSPMAPFAILIRTDGSDFQAEASERMGGRRKEANAERTMP